MSQLPLRFKEAVAQITVNGKKFGGTFANITNVEVTPDAEITKTQYAGERRKRPDLSIGGYDYSFQANKADHTWYLLWKLIEDAERNGTPFPVISFAITNQYRGVPHRTIVLYGNLIAKMDSLGYSDSEYATTKWSGSCQEMQG